jgi:hypothetical protein
VAAGEVVENLRFLQHREKLFVTIGRAAPFGRANVVPRPTRRRYQVLAEEHPQPLVHLPNALYVLLLQVAGYRHRNQRASLSR